MITMTYLSNHSFILYLFFFLLMFIETSASLLPFLPPAEAIVFFIAAMGSGLTQKLHPVILLLCLIIACILGDAFNFLLGKGIHHYFNRYQWFKTCYNHPLFKHWQLAFQKNKAVSIIVARFIPLVRSFALFLMSTNIKYRYFLPYNSLACSIWVMLWYFAGQKLGQLTFFQNHFSFITNGLLLLFIIPVIGYILKLIHQKNNPQRLS